MKEEPSRRAARHLADVVPRLGRLIATVLGARSGVALSLRQYRLLERLASRPHRIGELASVSDVSQATTSVALGPLEERGLVSRAPDPDDGRAILVVITQRGRHVLEDANAALIEGLVEVTSGFTDREADMLGTVKSVLVDGLDRSRKARRARRKREAT